VKKFFSEKFSIKEEESNNQKINDAYTENEFFFNQLLFYKDIPSSQPTTQNQIEFCKKHWSILIQPSCYSKLIYQHSEKEKENIFNIYIKLKDLKANENLRIESILYDPHKENIVSEADGDEADFPYNIKHSVLKCIDNFCMKLSADFILNVKNTNKNCFLGDKELIPKLNSDNDSNFEISDGDCIEHNNKLNYSSYQQHQFNRLDQYYCQGLYLFTWKEPCFMCSMALVHSRIERVYFMHYNDTEGALASLIKLSSYNLNHYFHVFKLNE